MQKFHPKRISRVIFDKKNISLTSTSPDRFRTRKVDRILRFKEMISLNCSRQNVQVYHPTLLTHKKKSKESDIFCACPWHSRTLWRRSGIIWKNADVLTTMIFIMIFVQRLFCTFCVPLRIVMKYQYFEDWTPDREIVSVIEPSRMETVPRSFLLFVSYVDVVDVLGEVIRQQIIVL